MLHIITDGMSDYNHASHRDPRVGVACQPVRFGMEEFIDDGISMPQEVFYARLRTATDLPQTSMVPMQTWKELIADRLQKPADEALIITGSSKLSGGYQSALLAVEKLGAGSRVRVVDSLNASCGEMHLVDEALRLQENGASLQEAADALEQLRDRVRIIGLADDLKYLVMGGRLNPLVGKVGNALSIKPTLKLEGGVIEKEGMVRGTKKGYTWYIEQLKQYPPEANSIIYVGGADCPDTTDMLRQMIADAGITNPVHCVSIGCLIGTHVGPGLTLVSWRRA